MDEGNAPEGETKNTETADNPKRFKTDNQEANETEAGEASEREPGCSNSETVASASGDSEFRKCRNVKKRNYRKSCDEESSGSESAEEEEEEQAETDILDRLSDISFASGDTSVIVRNTDTESENEEYPVLKKPRPKHKWFVVPEILNRQIGSRANVRNDILFQKRCYGSLYCVEKLELMYKLEKHQGCVNSLNFHPDGSLLASGSDDLKVVIWDWKHGKNLLSFDTKHKGNVFQSKFLSLSGDLHVVTAARDGQVRLHQVCREEGLRSSRKLGSHRGACHKLAVLRDQPHVVISVGEDGIVLNHDIRNPRPERIVHVKSRDLQEVALYSVSSNPMNSYEFCVSGRDRIVRAYDQRKCNSNVPLYTCYPKKATLKSLHVTCAVYNYDGTEILASYNDDDIYIFDVNSPPGSFKHTYQGHRNGATIKGVSYFGPKSEFIVSGSDCGYVYFWEKETEAIVQWMLADDNGVVNCLEPHPKFPFICTSGLDWDVKVWVPSFEEKPSLEGLAETVAMNSKARNSIWSSSLPTNIYESHMLWMWWRHMRRSSRNRNRDSDDATSTESLGLLTSNDVANLLSSSSTSSSNSDSDANNSNDDDEHLDASTGCNTS